MTSFRNLCPKQGVAAVLLPAILITANILAPRICHADLASELSAPGDAPQMRGLGVGCHWGRMPNWDINTGVSLLKQMGVQWVRDEWGWASVEKTKGVYAMPPAMGHRFDVLNAAGIKIICVLDYDNPVYENPLDPDAFANYAAWMVRTFKGKVAVWEIWNEPDNFKFHKVYGGDWDGRNDALWVAKYSELVGKAAAAIKKEDPNAVVIHNIEGASWGMALKNHGSDYAQTDGVDVHPYPAQWPAESTPYPENPKDGVLAITDATHSMVSVLDHNSIVFPKQSLGHAVQCWVGECGFSTYEPKSKKQHFAPVTEPQQAAYQVRAVLTGLLHGVKAWCIYDFINESANLSDVESNFGLVRDVSHHHEPKPSFYALQRLARLLGPDWQEAPDTGAKLKVDIVQPANANPWVKVNGPEMHWIKAGDRLVTIVWKAGESDLNAPPAIGSITWPGAPAGATAEAVDLVSGKSVDLNPVASGGGITLSKVPVGWAPVAIRWTIPGKSTAK